MSKKASILAAALSCIAGAALACGVCIDDKVAAVYDHAQVQQALTAGRVVVVCELSGAHAPGTLARRAGQAARDLPGVAPDSIRASNELPVMSFVLDPDRQSPEASVAELRRRLQRQDIAATLLKVLQAQSGGDRAGT